MPTVSRSTPLPDPNLKSAAAAVPPEPFSVLVEVDVAGLSHAGKVRPNNEDHFLIGRAGRYLDVIGTNVPVDEVPSRSDEVGYGMIVADGMGGYTGGEVASRLAIRSLLNLVLHTPDWIFRVDEAWGGEVLKRAQQRYRAVDREIARQAAMDPNLSRMGTTLTLAYSLGENLFISHVGDSRAYLLRQDKLNQLTRDQTLAQMLIDMGIMTREEAASNRLRHALTQALGKQEGNVKTEVHRLALRTGDCLLLCTDGLTEMVDEKRIAETLTRETNAAQACQRLVDLALEEGGRDNVTAVVARYRFPDGTPGD